MGLFHYFLDYLRVGAKDFAIVFNCTLTENYQLRVNEFGTYGEHMVNTHQGYKFLLILEREKEGPERERERNIDVRDKHQSVISDVCPNLESNTT